MTQAQPDTRPQRAVFVNSEINRTAVELNGGATPVTEAVAALRPRAAAL